MTPATNRRRSLLGVTGPARSRIEREAGRTEREVKSEKKRERVKERERESVVCVCVCEREVWSCFPSRKVRQ